MQLAIGNRTYPRKFKNNFPILEIHFVSQKENKNKTIKQTKQKENKKIKTKQKENSVLYGSSSFV